jgi:hypothetical protein
MPMLRSSGSRKRSVGWANYASVRSVEFHPGARDEFISAAQFYEHQTEGLGLDFITTVQHTYQRLLDFPASGPAFGRRLRRVGGDAFAVAQLQLSAAVASLLGPAPRARSRRAGPV